MDMVYIIARESSACIYLVTEINIYGPGSIELQRRKETKEGCNQINTATIVQTSYDRVEGAFVYYSPRDTPVDGPYPAGVSKHGGHVFIHRVNKGSPINCN